jgi:hypothetical protein
MALCFFRLRRADLLYIPIRKRASNITLPFMRALCAVLLLAIGIYTPPFPIPAFRWISSYNAPVFLVTEWEHSRPRPFCYCFRRAAAFVLFCFPAAPHMYVCVWHGSLFSNDVRRVYYFYIYTPYTNLYMAYLTSLVIDILCQPCTVGPFQTPRCSSMCIGYISICILEHSSKKEERQTTKEGAAA